MKLLVDGRRVYGRCVECGRRLPLRHPRGVVERERLPRPIRHTAPGWDPCEGTWVAAELEPGDDDPG